MFVNVLLFALEIVLCAVLVFYILQADKWAINMKRVIETGSHEVASTIKELKINLKKINVVLGNIKNFKYSLAKKIISQSLDLISILQLFAAEKHTKKLWKVMGLKIVKGFLLGLKMVNE